MAKVIESGGGDPLGTALSPQEIVQNLGDLSKGHSQGGDQLKGIENVVGSIFGGKANTAFEKAVAQGPGAIALSPETLPGSVNPGGFFSPPSSITGQSSKSSSNKKAKTTSTDPPQPTGTAAATTPAPDDVLTAGLGMFFSQYLAPMMGQINAQNNSMINQWGNTMNQMLQQPLPAGVKAIMQPWVAQNAQTLGMINTAAADQVAGQIPFNTLMNQLGQESSAQQALASALPTAAANQMLGGGGGAQAVGQMLANQGLANTPIGSSVLSLLSQPSLLQSLTGTQGKSGSSSSSGAQTNPQSITPIQVLPSTTTTPAATSTSAASTQNNLANTLYAQQLAQAMLNANQPSAQQANTAAASGYTP